MAFTHATSTSLGYHTNARCQIGCQALPHVIAADLRGMDGLDILGAGASTPRNSVVVGFWNDY